MTFRPEDVSTFLTLFDAKKRFIAAFPGCSHLDLLRDQDEENVFFTYSIWDSADDLDVYRRSDLFKEVWAETKKLFTAAPEAWSMDLEWSSGS